MGGVGGLLAVRDWCRGGRLMSFWGGAGCTHRPAPQVTARQHLLTPTLVDIVGNA